MSQALHDVYGMNLAASGKLALRAKGRLAEGTPDAIFDACVLLHEAAHLQQLALAALPTCPAVTRLASLVEECWYLVEGRDPPRAGEVWGQLLHARAAVDAPTAAALLTRLAPRYEAAQRAFATAVQASPALVALATTGVPAGPSTTAVRAARRGIAAVLAKFPGATSFWWMRYRLAEGAGDRDDAWKALSRARQLAPYNPRFAAIALLVAVWALPRDDAEMHLAAVRGSLDHAPAEVCLTYAHAEIALAVKAPPKERVRRLERALTAAEAGSARANSEGLYRNLTAVRLLLRELRAGREPTLEILYLAGLGALAAQEPPTADVADLLATRVRRLAAEPEREVAA